MATERETRVVTHVVEARAAAEGPRRLTGYAALYDTETVIGGLFREVIAPGAFRSALQRGDDVRALFNHDPNVLLGRASNGTLRLAEDGVGLRYEVDLPDTQAGRDLWTLVERGDITQSSFAFAVDDEVWERGDALGLRVVKDVRLFDVSPVTYPAYSETSVLARSAAAAVAAPPMDWRGQLLTLRAKTATVDVCGRGWSR